MYSQFTEFNIPPNIQIRVGSYHTLMFVILLFKEQILTMYNAMKFKVSTLTVQRSDSQTD